MPVTPVFVAAPKSVGITSTGETGENVPSDLPTLLGELAGATAVDADRVVRRSAAVRLGLAGRTVAKGAHVTGPTGRLFDQTNIGIASAMRDLGAHLRETGESKGYNAAFSPRDRSSFLETLDRLCRRAKSARTGA